MTKAQNPMINEGPSPRGEHLMPRMYDLEERTALFGEAIIAFAKTVPPNVVTIPLIGQMVRAGTSVGANYAEADEAHTKKEFLMKISTCRKESHETPPLASYDRCCRAFVQRSRTGPLAGSEGVDFDFRNHWQKREGR